MVDLKTDRARISKKVTKQGEWQNLLDIRPDYEKKKSRW